jgi:PTH1 family peptidyl-tRNA hydrolase
LRLKTKGSAGGQNGLKNIEECLMTQDYARLRFGIGSNFAKGQQSRYVLSNFSKDEMADLEININRAVDSILSFCTEGAAIAMNKFN